MGSIDYWNTLHQQRLTIISKEYVPDDVNLLSGYMNESKNPSVKLNFIDVDQTSTPIYQVLTCFTLFYFPLNFA
jgi:hypothetical protein